MDGDLANLPYRVPYSYPDWGAYHPPRHDWHDDAACLGADPDLFMPPRGRWDMVEEAKDICKSCPVNLHCLREGLAETVGIWGGTTSRERSSLRKQVKEGLSLAELMKKLWSKPARRKVNGVSPVKAEDQ